MTFQYSLFYIFIILYCILLHLVYLISHLTSTALAARNSVVMTSNVDTNIFYCIFTLHFYRALYLTVCQSIFIYIIIHIWPNKRKSLNYYHVHLVSIVCNVPVYYAEGLIGLVPGQTNNQDPKVIEEKVLPLL